MDGGGSREASRRLWGKSDDWQQQTAGSPGEAMVQGAKDMGCCAQACLLGTGCDRGREIPRLYCSSHLLLSCHGLNKVRSQLRGEMQPRVEANGTGKSQNGRRRAALASATHCWPSQKPRSETKAPVQQIEVHGIIKCGVKNAFIGGSKRRLGFCCAFSLS